MTGWTLADLLFPPECAVLYPLDGKGTYYFYNHDGERQVVVEEWIIDRLIELAGENE